MLGAASACVALVLLAGAQAIGILALESHRGYFAPVWSQDGHHVYFIERNTWGLIWGLGWEFFSPPADTYVLSDTISLRRIDAAGGAAETLETIGGSPLLLRITQHYRGRIFNSISARVLPSDDGAEFLVVLNIPRIPTSEQWSLKGVWRPGQPSSATWSMEWGGSTAAPDEVLRDGVELMTIAGNESFPAAILAVNADGTHRVLLRDGAFDELYPNGVDPVVIAERSNRAQIEQSRELERVQSELVARFLNEGLREGEAMLRANDEMEALGYFPKSPRLVAQPAREPPPELRVFDIPAELFRVGLFQDIAAAIEQPGAEVKTDTGTYLQYYDDQTGPELKAWREVGNNRFVVRTGDRIYVLEVRRFDR